MDGRDLRYHLSIQSQPSVSTLANSTFRVPEAPSVSQILRLSLDSLSLSLPSTSTLTLTHSAHRRRDQHNSTTNSAVATTITHPITTVELQLSNFTALSRPTQRHHLRLRDHHQIYRKIGEKYGVEYSEAEILNRYKRAAFIFNLISDQFVSSASSILRRYGFDKRDLQAQTNPTNLVNEDLANLEDGSSKPNNDANAINSSDTKFSASSEQKISPRHDLAMLFTCTVCETRSMKTCSRESYEKGVVVASCGGCNNLHLIADHLGYFGKPSNVEQLLAARGEEVKKGSADMLNLTLKDIAGIKPQG